MNRKIIWAFLSVFCLFACTEVNDLVQRDDDGVVVSFTAPGLITGEVGATTRADVKLAEDSTVRILVYHRTGVNADMANDTYINENTYKVKADGTLEACVVNDNGEIIAGTAKDLRLIQGKYDFYAITPAIKVMKEASTNAHKVSVYHGRDYATSLTQQKEVTTTSGAVTLDVLDRKCSLLEFNFDRKSANVSEIAIDEVSLSAMATAPLTELLAKDLPDALTMTAGIKLGNSVFKIDGTNKYQAKGSTITLPKPAGDFTLGAKLKFNGLSTQVVLGPATITNLALAKGTRYTFKIKLKGGSVTLTLVVSNWGETINVDADDLGASNSISIEVGKWEGIDFDGITGGGNLGGTVGNWVEDPNWSTELGKFPGLSMTTETPSWGDMQVNAPTGGGDLNGSNGNWGDGGTSSDDDNLNGSTGNWGDSSNTNEDFTDNQPGN